MGLGHNIVGLGHNETGTQWDWDTTRLELNGTGTQRDWNSTGLGRNGTGTQRDRDATGLELNGTGTQRAEPLVVTGRTVVFQTQGASLQADVTLTEGVCLLISFRRQCLQCAHERGNNNDCEDFHQRSTFYIIIMGAQNTLQ